MSNYIFFIGGSGARAYTAFLHCAAAGVLETKSVSAVMIDPDTTNKANINAKTLYDSYKRNYSLFQKKEDREIFTCDISMETEEILSPVSSHALTLESEVGALSANRKRMLNCFYTNEEKKQNLEHGFYAHPNIGCVFFSDFQCTAFTQCLQKMAEQLNQGESVSVALVGSIFGGTGAAGIPTIFKLIRDYFKDNSNKDKLSIGGIFVEPYFAINGTGSQDDITICAEEFYFNTYEALSYYQATGNGGFHSIYLVGQQELDIVNSQYADGGPEQDNKPHIVEVYAALALDRFFTNPEERGVFGTVRRGALNWRNFPQADAGSNKMLNMANFARAQSIFLTEICEFVSSRQGKSDSGGIMVPQWYVHYGIDSSSEKENFEALERYNIMFVNWLYKINCRCDARGTLSFDEDIKLFNSTLQNVYETTREDKKAEKKFNLSEFRNNFNTFIDTAANVEYVWGKIVTLLSLLGTIKVKAPVLGAAALFLEILSLAGRQKNKKRS